MIDCCLNIICLAHIVLRSSLHTLRLGFLAIISLISWWVSAILSERSIRTLVGILNIVHGLGASVGQAIVEHPQIKAISFTGGTATGKHISSVAGPMFKKVSLELGGKNPNIIFASRDWSGRWQIR